MFYVNDEPEGKLLYTEKIKLYSVLLLTRAHLNADVFQCFLYLSGFQQFY